MFAYGFFNNRQASEEQIEKKVFYVRWGGIPNWDPKTETLKKANTWGMGSGGFCLTSLHVNKIHEIISFAIEKHNGTVIKDLINKWAISKFATNSQDLKEFTDAILQHQIKRLHHLAKGQQIPEFLPPESWSKELIQLAQHALKEMPALIDDNSSVIHSKDLQNLTEGIVKYQMDKQRRDADKKPIAWSPPEKWTSLMRDVALEANSAVDRMVSSMQKAGIVPLFYTEKEYQQFYYEYCNKRLWPLFHRHVISDTKEKSGTLQVRDIFEVASCNTQAFKEYHHLSFETAKAVAKNAEPDGLVWLHDYHLFLLPKYLKEMRPDLKLGYHFHIPIPDGKLIEPLDDDIKSLFTSVMQCNYLSFNTQRDMENFKAIVSKMGLGTKDVIFENNPIGAQPVQTLEKNPPPKIQKTIEEIASLREKHQIESKSEPPFFQVILSVDRIEPSKGLTTRLKAIRDILESPSLDEQNLHLLFVMVCPDSRTGIKAYDELNKWFKEEIQQLNSLANKKIGRDIIKFHGEMSQTELQTLGQHADTFMVTSDADGLHLGPVEWLATRNYHDKDRQVNIILSKGAGVSEYFPHAMTFNPGDHQRLTTLLCQTTTETNADKTMHSDKIKQDFQEGQAKGFNLDTWRAKAAKGLAGGSEKIKQEVKAKPRGPDQVTGNRRYGTFDTEFRRNLNHQKRRADSIEQPRSGDTRKKL